MNILTACSRGCVTRVSKINASGALKQRLLSFGIMKGVLIEVMAFTANKSTVEIRVGSMKVALRREEAELVEVEA